MCSVEYPDRTLARLLMVRISRPAPTSSASVSAIWTIVTSRSRRRSRRVFLLALQSAHEQQGRGVAAGDQQDEDRGAEERQQDAAAVVVHLVGERLHEGCESLEVAIGLRLPSGNRPQLGLGLFRR